MKTSTQVHWGVEHAGCSVEVCEGVGWSRGCSVEVCEGEWWSRGCSVEVCEGEWCWLFCGGV